MPPHADFFPIYPHTLTVCSGSCDVYTLLHHRKAPSDSSMAWLKVLARAGIPVLVCLTHADKLVAELMPRPGVVPDSTESNKCVEEKRQVCGGRHSVWMCAHRDVNGAVIVCGMFTVVFCLVL